MSDKRGYDDEGEPIFDEESLGDQRVIDALWRGVDHFSEHGTPEQAQRVLNELNRSVGLGHNVTQGAGYEGLPAGMREEDIP